ncbi:unnamed protein product, partial [Mesorhabditis spiculigera]
MNCAPKTRGNFEIYTESPVDENSKDTNIIHQLDRQLKEKFRTVDCVVKGINDKPDMPTDFSHLHALNKKPQPLSVHVPNIKTLPSSSTLGCSTVYEDAISSTSQEYIDALADFAEPVKVSVAEEPSEDFVEQADLDDFMLTYMLERQKILRLPNYLYQTEVTEHARTVVVEWLSSVCLEYGMHIQTFCLGVAIIDKFLSVTFVEKQKLQLVASSAIWIASKLEEIYPLEMHQLVFSMDNAFNEERVRYTERLILEKLDFNLGFATSYWFASRFSHQLKVSSLVRHMVRYLTELALVEYFLTQFRPSTLGAAIVHTSLFIVDGASLHSESLSKLIDVDQGELETLSKELVILFKDAPKRFPWSIYEAFSDPVHGCVATIACPAVPL